MREEFLFATDEKYCPISFTFLDFNMEEEDEEEDKGKEAFVEMEEVF